jgi:hypothetical protein
VKRAEQTTILREGETTVIEAGVWHDWWNASNRNARVRVEITPGERFSHMVETLFGLARLGRTDNKGMPNMLQLAVIAQEFSDVVVFRAPRWPYSACFSAPSLRSHAGEAIARRIRNSHERYWRRGRRGRKRASTAGRLSDISAGMPNDRFRPILSKNSETGLPQKFDEVNL